MALLEAWLTLGDLLKYAKSVFSLGILHVTCGSAAQTNQQKPGQKALRFARFAKPTLADEMSDLAK